MLLSFCCALKITLIMLIENLDSLKPFIRLIERIRGILERIGGDKDEPSRKRT